MGVSAFHRAYWDGRAYRRTKIYQRDHTFQFGDVVRVDATGQWVLACADTLQNAEGLAIVSHSGYRGANNTASTAEYARRALPSYAFDHRTQTDQECNDPRHFFSVVFRGEITIPDNQDINYDEHALLTGTSSVPQAYTPGGVYYLSPFPDELGKLICKSPLEFGGKMASSVVKPMLIALDHSRAVVVNYIGSKLDSLPDEWVHIQDVQKVGAIGAFLENNLPQSWIAADGRLCTTAQYPQLSQAIGGSVRVPATLTLEANPPQADVFTGVDGYCILDFSGEDIDVSAAVVQEPLNLRLESSGSMAEISAIIDGVIDENRLRVIIDRDVLMDGMSGAYQVGVPLNVKVRAPHLPGIDAQFFVPNLRNRTVRGADPFAVFAGAPTRQSDLGDYSGSNTATLDEGIDILGGAGYSATVDTRVSSVNVIFAIKTNTVDCGSFINDCCTELAPVGLNDNAIINGAFLVWQRGKEFSRETFDAQPQYTADRWFEDFNLSPPIEPPLTGTYHVLKKGVKYTHFNPAAMVAPLLTGEQASVNARPEELPDSITTYAQVQGTLMTALRPHGSPTTSYTVSSALITGSQESYHYLENRIEDVRTLSNERVTLSFWARGTQVGSIYVSMRQHFAGTRGILDDAYSAPVQILVDGTANWNRYEVTLDIPDVQETKPSDGYIGGNSFLGVQFWTMHFAGTCTGTANPTVYDSVIATPGPETEQLPFRAGIEEVTGPAFVSGCSMKVNYDCFCAGGACDAQSIVWAKWEGCFDCNAGQVQDIYVIGGPTSQNSPDACESGIATFSYEEVAIPSCGSFAMCPGSEGLPCSLNGAAVGQEGCCVCLSCTNIRNTGDVVTEIFDRVARCSGAEQPCITPAPTQPSTPAGTPASTPDGTPASTPAGTPGGTPAGTPASTPGGTPASTPASTPAGTPARTSQPTPTATATVAASPAPTQTSQPTPTPTPVTPTPSPSGQMNHECVQNCCLPVLFDADFNYEGVLHLTGVQLIRGIKALPFEETDYLDELKKCQRYYERDQFIPIGGPTKSLRSGDFYESVNFMVQKRRVKEPCVHIQGYYDSDAVTGCTLNTIDVDCYNDESAVLHLNATPTSVGLELCAAYVEFEVDVDLYESPCPADPYCGTTLACGWEEVS